jgi:hypothetical protein
MDKNRIGSEFQKKAESNINGSVQGIPRIDAAFAGQRKRELGMARDWRE